MRRSPAVLLPVVVLCCTFAVAQDPGGAPTAAGAAAAAAEPVDAAAVAFFREEGLQRSQVMDHLSWLCDVYGPRLTGSPNLRKAQDWAIKTFASMGYAASTEAWGPFGRSWSCQSSAMAVVGDNPWPVIAYPKAWSPSVPRTEAEVVHAAAMTKAQLEAADLAGKVVLIEEPRAIAEAFDGYSRRLADVELQRMADPKSVPPAPPAARLIAARNDNDFRVGFAKREEILAIVQQKRPLAMVDRAGKGDYGVVFVAGAAAAPKPGATRGRGDVRAVGAEVIPQFTIAVEHYNRMVRLLQKGLPVRVVVELQATYHEQDLDDRNVLADLKGGDPVLGGELAMLGAHVDSWHAGAGTTDNGCGSAVVMEAARLIAAWTQKSGVQPRRTVRAALWSGEEQGLLGSNAYVQKRVGTAKEPKDEHGRIAGYFNLDNGTGRIRGVYLQGNDACGPIFRSWLQPFADLDASTITRDDTGGTDHLAFHGVGVPGFQFIQDPVSYSTRTHHSNMDVWDHAVADDLKQAAVVMATFVWHTAQREQKLPRPASAEAR